MNKTWYVMLTILAVSLNSSVLADNKTGKQSPETIVTCMGRVAPMAILATSIPEAVNVERCRTATQSNPPDLCAPCITSLEDQGCIVIDNIVTNLVTDVTDINGVQALATWTMSCVKP